MLDILSSCTCLFLSRPIVGLFLASPSDFRLPYFRPLLALYLPVLILLISLFPLNIHLPLSSIPHLLHPFSLHPPCALSTKPTLSPLNGSFLCFLFFSGVASYGTYRPSATADSASAKNTVASSHCAAALPGSADAYAPWTWGRDLGGPTHGVRDGRRSGLWKYAV